MASDPSPSSASSEKPLAIAARNFLVGASLSGAIVLAYLWLSVDMTYGSWAAVGATQLGIAIAVPLLGGLLFASLGPRAMRVLAQIAESTNLPF